MDQVHGFFSQIANLTGAYVPKIAGAILLVIAAWIIGSILRVLVRRIGGITRLDERAGFEVSSSLGEAVFWLSFLFFLPGILEALGLEQLLLPVQQMMAKLMGFLPNILGAGLIFTIGWFVGKLVRRAVAGLSNSVGVDRLGERFGLAEATGGRRLSDGLGTAVFALIVIAAAQAALNALQIDVITRPIESVMTKTMDALPNLLGAAILMLVIGIIARVLGRMVGQLLSGLGLDAVLTRLGLHQLAGQSTRVSSVIAWFVTAAILLLGAMEAANLLGFTALNVMLANFSVFAAQLVLGLVIFGIGLYLANLAGNAVERSGVTQASLLGLFARGAVLVFSATMALRQMGLAPEIVTIAFTLLLGALAVAFALAFGLGGREAAGRVLDSLVQRLKG